VKSCAHWLNWKCGIDLGAAREKVRVARALETLPAIRETFRRGELSYSKVRAMTRVATPDNETYLLMIAQHGTAAHVEQAVRAYRRVGRIEAAERANAAHERRSCRWHYDDDGMLVLEARLPAEAGAQVVEALAAAMDDLDDAGNDVSAATSEPGYARGEAIGARRADGLAHLAGQFLVHGARGANGAGRFQVVLHVDQAALRGDDEHGRCAIAHGPDVAPDTARRIACDAALVALREGPQGQPLDVGRRTRSVPAAMRRALESRDRGCRFPGCTCRRYVDAHHVEHWADGGRTSSDNLVLLCRRHHRLVHEGGFRVEHDGEGGLVFYTPQGAVIPDVPRPVPATAWLPEQVAAHGIRVSAETPVPAWQGERMDLAMVMDGLLRRDGVAL
jgi:hypothetical protein